MQRERDRPTVTLKIAQSLDGKIATSAGHSRWITGPASRAAGHALRAQHDAILVGIGTVLADDPELTVRHVPGRHPARVVLDSSLRLPAGAAVLRETSAPVIVMTTRQASAHDAARLQDGGARVITVAERDGRVDLAFALSALRELGIGSVLIEGGAQVATEALRRDLVDRVVVFVAPKLIGRGLDAVGDLGTVSVDDAISFDDVSVELLEGELVFRGAPRPRSM